MRAILTYHSIDETGSVISVDPEAFRGHVEWLASGAVKVMTVDELLRSPAEDDAVALTFDDAFENFGSLAWPILRDHGLQATVFVVCDHAGGTNGWGRRPEPGIPELPLLDWDALARLAQEGVQVGSHSMTHRRLGGLDDAAIEEEMAESARMIEARTGVAPNGFAYPYGLVEERCRRAAAAHYAWACTTELAVLDEDVPAHALPRLDMFYYRAPGRLEAWGSSAFSTHLWLRGQARRLRSAIALK